MATTIPLLTNSKRITQMLALFSWICVVRLFEQRVLWMFYSILFFSLSKHQSITCYISIRTLAPKTISKSCALCYAKGQHQIHTLMQYSCFSISSFLLLLLLLLTITIRKPKRFHWWWRPNEWTHHRWHCIGKTINILVALFITVQLFYVEFSHLFH